MAASDGHPSAEHVFEQICGDFPTTSLATVYKTIALLKDMGEVLELYFDHNSRYDGNRPYPHAHLICVECRAIIDADTDMLQALPQRIAEQANHRTYDLALAILHEEVEHESWFTEFLG